ncbi:MAG TPA: pantoate--beta-alanine ligase [Rhizomicrobium sp.]|jgi:pantoate--beta-alanine ligase|nr:pantoate--beta-alanine ligase [Rhizomicrobium sp.]
MTAPVLIATVAELRRALEPLRKDGVALVPTMGALHDGHLALVAAARERTRHVAVSIFVNPTQFAPHEDFSSYPRGLEADATKLAAARTTLIFAPPAQEMYPDGFATTVSVKGPATGLESDFRPHFFDGVATIVAKLLIAAAPDYVLFGEKDYQQLLVVKRLVRDLALPVEIIAVPIAREADGLAMSSRNAYLSQAERKVAGQLNLVLKDVVAALQRGADVVQAQSAGVAALKQAGFESVDYVALRDAESLAPVSGLEKPVRLLAAARIGKIRLIDNFPI